MTLDFLANATAIPPRFYPVDIPADCVNEPTRIPDVTFWMHPGRRPIDPDDRFMVIDVVCDFAGVVQHDVELNVKGARLSIPIKASPQCDGDRVDPDGSLRLGLQDLCRRYDVQMTDGNHLAFWVQYIRGEDVTHEVTLSGFADCNSGGVISIHEAGALDRGTPSGGCGSWLIGNPLPFS